jgi:hypothetical protein
VNDAELRAKLTLRPCSVHLSKAVLPESAPDWQQRVIVDRGGIIGRRVCDARALELSRNLPAVINQRRSYFGDGSRFLLEQYFPNHRLHVCVG